MKIRVSARTARALQKIKELSKTSEEQLQYYLAEHGPATTYDLAKKLNWGVGKVDGVVRRLKKKGLVKFEKKIEEHAIKKYYELVPAEELLVS